MLWDAARAEFERNGFVVVRQFLAATDFAVLRENLDRFIREVVPGLPASHAFFLDPARPETLKQLHRMNVDPFFEAQRHSPHWVGLAEALLGEPAEAFEPEWFNKPRASNHPTPPHQDNYYFCLKPANVLTIWLALDRVDQDNGCLRYVSGSHRDGIRSHSRTDLIGFSQGISDFGEADLGRESPIALEPGDAVVHHGNTIHRADGNRSPSRDRRALAMVFRGQSCRRDEQAYARYQASAAQQRQSLEAQAK